jgi:tRNA A37 methylthiotransferase MiaB
MPCCLRSGSDAVVPTDGAPQCVSDFEALALAAREAIPGLTITTDLITGFPGETEADFEETVNFARRVGFAPFTFSLTLQAVQLPHSSTRGPQAGDVAMGL